MSDSFTSEITRYSENAEMAFCPAGFAVCAAMRRHNGNMEREGLSAVERLEVDTSVEVSQGSAAIIWELRLCILRLSCVVAFVSP